MLYLTGYGLDARRPQAVPPARLADRRPPRVRPRGRDRDHHRAARPGDQHRRRHGARRADAGRALQPRGPRDRRPLHVRDRVRRRPPGGRRVRGLLARRPPRPRPPDRVLGRQPHLDRGRHRAVVHRGRRARATRPTAGTSRTSARTSGSSASRRRWPTPGRHRPAEPDRRPHPHRARLAEQAGHARGARRAARRGGDPAHQGGLQLAQPGAVLRPRRGARALPLDDRARRGARVGVARALRGLPRRATRTRRRSSSGCSRASCPRAGTPTCPRRARTRA